MVILQFLLKKISVLAICMVALGSAISQTPESPVVPLEKINSQMEMVNEKYLRYMSETAHGKARKAVKKHEDFLAQIDKAKYALAEIPYYKGDKGLHESAKGYLTLIANLQRENYSKIVNMEDIAEKSYDAMEAFLLFKRKVNERMEEASQERHLAVKSYCVRHNITLQEGKEDERSAKMKKLDGVMEYYDKIYLIVFKAMMQDELLVEAMDKKNLTSIEQIKGSLGKYALEGLQQLDTVKSFMGSDITLKNSAKRLLDFYKKEAGMIDNVTDFYIKEEDFATIKKNFERSAKAQNNQGEIDKYNAAVNDLNKAVNKSNDTINQMNKGRAEAINQWNETVKRFMDNHVPYSK
jgi:hypothetical protein